MTSERKRIPTTREQIGYKLRDMNLPFTIPVIMSATHGDWVHPDIAEFVDGFDNKPMNQLVGPLVLANFKDPSFDDLYVVFTLDDDHYEQLLDPSIWESDKEEDNEAIQDIIESLIITLIEDVWVVGGKQFCFTEFGEKIGNVDSSMLEFVTFDVSISTDGKGDWWWDS